MKTNIEKLEQNLVKLSIEIDEPVAASEYNKACRKISENVNIHGFRKGKAPKAMVEKYVGSERIQREALSNILPGIFADIISENQFDVITEPQVESFEYETGKPLSVVAVLELKPEVTLGAYKNVEVEVEEFKNAGDAIEKELKTLQDRTASLEPVIDRATTANDVVIMDFEGSVDGEVIKGGTAKNYQLDLANSTFIKGFAEQLIDKKIGEEFTIDVTFPEDYHDASLQGKPAQFKIKINEIKERKLMELNDEFAKKLGKFKTLDELKKDIQEYLDQSVKQENEQRVQKAIIEKIVETSKVDVPDSMVNREAKQLMNEMQQRLKAQGINFDQVVDEKGHENLWAELREEASKRVKNSLVLAQIAEAENIHVSEEEFEEKIKELAAMYGTEEKDVYNQLAKNLGMASALTQQLLAQNITKFLEDNNKFKYVSK
ncbi:MAG: trigger factor [Candidatus Gastranaerophilales bacterium]|nr:trigger factor [Candidatus Gastranaerophilales bacterium]